MEPGDIKFGTSAEYDRETLCPPTFSYLLWTPYSAYLREQHNKVGLHQSPESWISMYADDAMIFLASIKEDVQILKDFFRVSAKSQG